jgi:hypothetical protein
MERFLLHLRCFALAIACAIAAWPDRADAAPATASGSVSTSKGASGKSTKYDWPELVVAGDAISFLAPLEFGIVSYLPKGRFAFQYDRQIRKNHWVDIGFAALFDHAGYKNFRMDQCGFQTFPDRCKKGGVGGIDVWVGYTYKFFVQKRPYLVPYLRANLGYMYFALPKIGGAQQQDRVHSQGLSLRPGTGLRIFLLEQLGVGFDIGIPFGFLVHGVRPDGGGKQHNTTFLLGVEVQPLVVEYRF